MLTISGNTSESLKRQKLSLLDCQSYVHVFGVLALAHSLLDGVHLQLVSLSEDLPLAVTTAVVLAFKFTSGSLTDMIRRRSLRTRAIKMLVLDEADEMLNKGKVIV